MAVIANKLADDPEFTNTACLCLVTEHNSCLKASHTLLSVNHPSNTTETTASMSEASRIAPDTGTVSSFSGIPYCQYSRTKSNISCFFIYSPLYILWYRNNRYLITKQCPYKSTKC